MIGVSEWLLFVAIGVGTFAIRLSFIELYGRLRIPPLLNRALAYVPASVLAALVLPAIVFPNGDNQLVLLHPQIPAAIVAGLIAWFSRSTLLSIASGMCTLWLLQFLLG